MPNPKTISLKNLTHSKEFIGCRTRGIRPAGEKKSKKEPLDFYEKMLSSQQFETMNLIRKTGVPVERVIRKLKAKQKTERFIVQRNGLALNWLTPEKARIALRQLPEMLSKVHSIGVSHVHPHEANVYVTPKGRLGLIDFKESKRDPKIFEKTPEEIVAFLQWIFTTQHN